MAVVGGVACSSGDPAGPETSASPAATAVVSTTLPDFGAPHLDELPTVVPIRRFTIEGEDQPVFASEAGLWFMGYGDTDEGLGWRIWWTDGGDDPSSAVRLPVESTNNDEVLVADGVLWAPAVQAGTSDGVEGSDSILRFDLRDLTADVFPAPGRLFRLEADGSTVWAEVLGTGSRTIVGFDESGPVGEAMEISGAAEADDVVGDVALGAILLPTLGGVYDCLAGSWGFTGSSGERIEVPISSGGCNAVAVDPGFVIGIPGGLRLLGTDGTAREIAVPDEFGESAAGVDLTCDGPAQRGDVIVALCGRLGNTTFAVRVDLVTMSATVEPTLDIENLGVRRLTSVLGQNGRFGAIEVEQDLSTVGAVVADLSGSGELVWTHVVLDDLGGGAKSFDTHDDDLWVRQHVGEPGEPLYTWYEVVTAG